MAIKACITIDSTLASLQQLQRLQGASLYLRAHKRTTFLRRRDSVGPRVILRSEPEASSHDTGGNVVGSIGSGGRHAKIMLPIVTRAISQIAASQGRYP